MSESDNDTSIGKALAWAPAIQHPLDRMYLKKIEGIPLMPKIIGWVVDSQRAEMEALFSGDGVLVTANSCPEVDAAFCEVCEALDLNRAEIRLFVMASPTVNAFTTGSGIPTVVTTSAMVNAFSKSELKFVFGHELGHYICGHVRCHTLARLLAGASWYTPGWIAGLALEPMLMSWSRYSELSADRAGLLACNDFEVACSVLLKLGGFPYMKGLPESCSKVLVEQCIDYEKQTGRFSILRRLWREVKHGFFASHPRVVERFASLDEWMDMGCHEELVAASTEERVRLAAAVDMDCLRNELNLMLVETAVGYIVENNITDKKTAFSLLRKAFLHGGSLRDTQLERLVYAELAVAKGKGRELVYTLTILFSDGSGGARKVAIPVDYSPDWDFAPDGIRAKFIESRQSELKILVYKP